MLLYYLPGYSRDIKLDQLRKTPIGYALEQRFVACSCSGGPDGGDGVIVADAPDASKVGYYPEQQQWAKIPSPQSPAPSPACWVGKYAGPVAPESLARRDQLGGHWVTLADDQEWLCPVARSFSSDDGPPRWLRQLPSGVNIDDDGNWIISSVVDRYAHLWEIAEKWFQAWSGAEASEAGENGKTTVEFDFSGGLDAALTCLQTNYRLGKAEAVLLGLFDHMTPRVVLNALIDEPTYMDWFQKKSREESAGSNTDAGSVVSTQDTDPP